MGVSLGWSVAWLLGWRQLIGCLVRFLCEVASCDQIRNAE